MIKSDEQRKKILSLQGRWFVHFSSRTKYLQTSSQILVCSLKTSFLTKKQAFGCNGSRCSRCIRFYGIFAKTFMFTHARYSCRDGNSIKLILSFLIERTSIFFFFWRRGGGGGVVLGYYGNTSMNFNAIYCGSICKENDEKLHHSPYIWSKHR